MSRIYYGIKLLTGHLGIVISLYYSKLVTPRGSPGVTRVGAVLVLCGAGAEGARGGAEALSALLALLAEALWGVERIYDAGFW